MQVWTLILICVPHGGSCAVGTDPICRQADEKERPRWTRECLFPFSDITSWVSHHCIQKRGVEELSTYCFTMGVEISMWKHEGWEEGGPQMSLIDSGSDHFL